MEFIIKNFGGPNLTLEVTNAGYLIDARKVPPDIAWLFDMVILGPEPPHIFESFIDTYMTGMGHPCCTSSPDVDTVVLYVQEHWELKPC